LAARGCQPRPTVYRRQGGWAVDPRQGQRDPRQVRLRHQRHRAAPRSAVRLGRRMGSRVGRSDAELRAVTYQSCLAQLRLAVTAEPSSMDRGPTGC